MSFLARAQGMMASAWRLSLRARRRRSSAALTSVAFISVILSLQTLLSNFVSPLTAKREGERQAAGRPHQQQFLTSAEPSAHHKLLGAGGASTAVASSSPLLAKASLPVLASVAVLAALRRRRTRLAALAGAEAPAEEAELVRPAAAEAEEIPHWLPRAALLLFALFCSTNFTLIKVLEAQHSEAAVQAVRFCGALLPFLPLISKHSSKQSIVSGVEIGLWCAVGYFTQAMGLPHTEASKGAFLCSLTMLVVPMVKFLQGQQVKPQIWGAVVVAVAGTALLLGLGAEASLASLGYGELFCGATALGFGLMFARMDEYAKEPDYDVLGCTIWQVVTLAVCMIVWLLASAGPVEAVQQVTSLLSGGPEVLGTLFWVSLVTTAGVLYVETWAMERMDGAEAGIIFASEPVWATIFASLTLGEQIGAKEGLGGLLIVLACILTQVPLGESRKEAAAADVVGMAKEKNAITA
eukprot:TRINITY_DN90504_c0_g1_i1.p1 TRINITY_DN90504_c0_g1~~TRINITY_DN90504_c0_g1_i1.p1  ORF type:complete len:489 (+),score=106.35 TRINITY_DN90504_c0_g1_i1:69-1469(+)